MTVNREKEKVNGTMSPRALSGSHVSSPVHYVL